MAFARSRASFRASTPWPLGLGVALALGLALPVAGGRLAAPEAQAQTGRDTPVVLYQGKLQGGDRKPIGGVYPLTFSLHRRDKGGKTLWSESHFVAVDHGAYVVELGARRAMPMNVDLEDLFLAVSLTGGDEIVREKLDPESIRASVATPTAAAPAAAAPAASAGGRQVVDYAEEAGLAYEAEHAKAADKVGELSADDIKDALKSAGSKVSVGSTKRYTASAGGEGGVQYELTCPKGFVVTGIRGGSGLYIDSVQLICSPLE